MTRPQAKLDPLTPEQSRQAAGLIDMIQATAAAMTRHFRGAVTFHEALASAGLGAVRATSTFDPRRGTRLRNHAYAAIRGQIVEDVRKRGRWFSMQPTKTDQSPSMRFGPRPSRHDPAPPEPVRNLAPERRVDECGCRSRGSKGVNGEELEAFEHRIGALPISDRQRKVLRLRYVDGLSMREIGRRMGRSEAWTSHQLAGIITKARAVLKPAAA